MAYKALVSDLIKAEGGGVSFNYWVSILDTTNWQTLSPFLGEIVVGTDWTVFTPAGLQSVIESQILTYAGTQNLTMSASDILYGSPSLWTPTEVTAVKAATQSRSFGSASRTLNSAFQISSTRDSLVSYSVDINTQATLLGGQTGTVFLEYANDSGFTSGVTEVARFVNGNSVSLAIAITLNQNVTGTLTGAVPAGKYVRIRTANTTGTPTFTYRSGQEVLM